MVFFATVVVVVPNTELEVVNWLESVMRQSWRNLSVSTEELQIEGFVILLVQMEEHQRMKAVNAGLVTKAPAVLKVITKELIRKDKIDNSITNINIHLLSFKKNCVTLILLVLNFYLWNLLDFSRQKVEITVSS